MSRYNNVYSRLWARRDFRAMTEDGRALVQYLLTCSARTTEGLFRLPLPLAAHDIQWEQPRTVAAFAELTAAGFIETDPAVDLVWLILALQDEQPKGPKQVIGAVNVLAEIPDSPLRSRFLTAAWELCKPFAEAIETRLGWASEPVDTLCDTPSIPYRRGIGDPDSVKNESPGQSDSIPYRRGIEGVCDTPSIAHTHSLPLAQTHSPPPPGARERSAAELAAAAEVADGLLERIGHVGDAARASDDLIDLVADALANGWPATNLNAGATEIGAMPDSEIRTTRRKVLLGMVRKRVDEMPPPGLARPPEAEIDRGFTDLTGLPDDPDAEIAHRYESKS